MSRRRQLLIAAIAVALVVGILVIALLRDRAPSTSLVTVRANQNWTDSGLDLRRGQRFRIIASGVVSCAPGAMNGPEGGSELEGSVPLLISERPCALIARIGVQLFLAGQESSHTAFVDGRLYLGVNDVTIRDNNGSFEVNVNVIE